MARILNEKEYAARRNEILDAAQQLVYTKGYEQMTIQDILDSLQISKGGFYHYFGSKGALLEALIKRMQDEGEAILVPIMQDTHLPALEKIERFFVAAASWKTAQKAYLLALLRVWYTDDNAIVRQKMTASTVKRFTPMLKVIIQQGIQEGVLATSFPEQVGEVALSLTQSLGDALAGLLLSSEPQCNDLKRVETTVAAYTDALERVLGAPAGSLHLVDMATLEEWFSNKDAQLSKPPNVFR